MKRVAAAMLAAGAMLGVLTIQTAGTLVLRDTGPTCDVDRDAAFETITADGIVLTCIKGMA